ncbi:MAG: diaminopimelate decarboxylase [Deltaproteobacteria bacterium]|nr:diaminopimelate decarboxylase [Deltaproteobacteria bacterium]
MGTSREADGRLALGGVALEDIARDPRFGTPTYVYDLDAIAREARELRAAFGSAPHLVAYAVKANSAGPIVKALAGEGCGADVVSGAELLLAARCGVAYPSIVYSGVAKSDDELDLAIQPDPGIGAVQVESVEELHRVAARARTHRRIANVSLRINPGVDTDTLDTHSYIATGHDEAKFGMPLETVPGALDFIQGAKEIRLAGIGAHVGSQLTNIEGYLASARVVFGFVKEVRARFALSFVDTGGGFGIDYGQGCPVRPADFIVATRKLQAEHGLDDLALTCEPGRSLVGAHGVLLARVIQRKIAPPRRWTMIDAGMNDLMRPALYQAFHRIVPLSAVTGPVQPYRVVGPVCESSDDFGMHELPDTAFDFAAILDAGAYGYSMASRYNGRAMPAEVFLQGGRVVAASARAAREEWIEDRLRPSPIG